MGAKATVTEEVYNKIKKECLTSKDDPKVMKKYNLGQTTVRAIRRTNSYNEFLIRVKRAVVIKGYKMYKLDDAYINPKALEKNDPKPDKKLVIAMSIIAAVLVIGAIIGLIKR
jgi:hypothetical protein